MTAGIPGAGIPGAGIAGLFYLTSAFLMPVQEVRRAIRGRSTPASRRHVTRHFLTASSMLATLWATAWLLEYMLKFVGLASTTRRMPALLTYSAFVLSSVTLIAILTGVQLMRLVLRPRKVPLESTATTTTVPSLAPPSRFRTRPRVLTYDWTKNSGQVKPNILSVIHEGAPFCRR